MIPRLSLRRMLPVLLLTALSLAFLLLHQGRAQAPKDKAGDGKIPKDVTNSIGMKLKLIPKGKFTMGSPKSERDDLLASLKVKEAPDWLKAEGPQHEVEISQPFYLGVYEVTQGQYEKVMAKNPSWFSAKGGGKDAVKGLDTAAFPVERVSWTDAKAFCDKLSALPKEKAAGRVYRLPTEAEWEYACRAGTTMSFHFGKALSSTQANFDGRLPDGGADKGPYLRRTCAVGSYPANAFGLHDMHGNVFEWCADWYGKDYYGVSSKKDPQGPISGTGRVVRGGSCSLLRLYCRAACRLGLDPVSRDSNFGFRVACSLPKARP
jgi:formylglycine-generating enzyme